MQHCGGRASRCSSVASAKRRSSYHQHLTWPWGSRRAPGLLLPLLLLLAAHLLLPARAACKVRLDIDPAASTLLLSSDNLLRATSPPVFDIPSPSGFPANVTRGFQGSLYASSTALASCPSPGDAAGWLAAWSSFNLSSAASPTLWQVRPPARAWRRAE